MNAVTMSGVKVYTESKSTKHAMESRYLRQSNEAEANGRPYIVIRPKTTYAHIICDWITVAESIRCRHPGPIDQFVRMAALCLEQRWPMVKVKFLCEYTVLTRVPKIDAEAVAKDLADIANQSIRSFQEGQGGAG